MKKRLLILLLTAGTLFVFHTKAGGLRKCVFPHLDGKLVSLDACFDQNHAVLSLALDHNGRREHHLTMLAADGSLVAHSQEPDPGFDADAGRCVAWGSVLTATDDGLALLCARSVSWASTCSVMSRITPITAGFPSYTILRP